MRRTEDQDLTYLLFIYKVLDPDTVLAAPDPREAALTEETLRKFAEDIGGLATEGVNGSEAGTKGWANHWIEGRDK